MPSTPQENVTDNYLIIKGRFKSPNIYGQVIIIFNPAKAIESYNIVASNNSETYAMEPQMDWNQVEEFIADVKWKGNFSNSLTVSLMNYFESYQQDYSAINGLYNFSFDYNYDSLEVTLTDQINRIAHDKNLVIETVIQEVSPEDYNRVIQSRTQPKGPEVPEEPQSEVDELNLSQNAVILDVKPIVAPVKGKPIYAIKIGDKIMVNILPKNDRANYVIDLLDLRDDAGVKPAVGKVVDIKAGTSRKDPIEIITEITADVYGKFFEDEHQVKLKLYNPVEYEAMMAASSNTDETSQPLGKGPLVMAVMFIIIMAVFIVLLGIGWF